VAALSSLTKRLTNGRVWKVSRALGSGHGPRSGARTHADDIAPMIQAARDAGANSLREITACLNQNGIPAPRGGEWKPTQVARVLRMLEN
jgi:hypothetical protein